jgi:hypothetical protein
MTENAAEEQEQGDLDLAEERICNIIIIIR